MVRHNSEAFLQGSSLSLQSYVTAIPDLSSQASSAHSWLQPSFGQSSHVRLTQKSSVVALVVEFTGLALI